MRDPNTLSGDEALDALLDIYGFMYRTESGMDFETEVSGADLVQHCAGVFDALGLLPNDGQWKTTCPKCHWDGLIVLSATLVANGKIIHPCSPLERDGFDVDPRSEFTNLNDLSTQDEVVLCPQCKAEFPLGDLAQ